MVTASYISITTLNINGLNDSTKRHKLAKWIQKQETVHMLSTTDPLQTKRHI